MQTRVKFIFFLLVVPFFQPTLFADEVFRYKYPQGTKYRILSEVEEEVLINGRFSHHSKITNKVSTSIVETLSGKSGRIVATFYVTEDFLFNNQHFNQLTETYQSDFVRDSLGVYSDDEDDIMPVVRNAPRFPEHPIKEGESWSAEGFEVHDFSREPFFLHEPFRFPVLIHYTYQGKFEKEGKLYDQIKIKYSIFHTHNPPSPRRIPYPKRIMGFSDQILLWDNEAGRPHFYSEEFHHIVTTSDGNEIEFKGRAQALVLDSKELNAVKLKKELSKELNHEGLKGISIVEKEEGLALIIDNIQFYPDSSKILPGEELKLKKISDILAKYKERDIRITGHTADVGNFEEQEQLSIERATIIAKSFIQQGVRKESQIMIAGKGSREPIASNHTEEGRKKNRRVEILILEN